MQFRRSYMYSLQGVEPVTPGSIGTLLAWYKGHAPTSTSVLDGYNTVHATSGKITRFYDFSGRGKHLYFDDSVNASVPVVSGIATFNGTPYSDPVDLGFNPGTIYVETDAMPTNFWLYYIGTANTYFGNLSSATGMVNETYSTITTNSPQDYLATDATIPSGFKRIGHTVSVSNAADSGIYLNGVAKSLLLGQKAASNLGSIFGFARNQALTGARISGAVKNIVLYQEAFTPAQMATLDGLITA